MMFFAAAMMLSVRGVHGAEFTYQGELRTGGAIATGNADFRFRLFASTDGSVQIGPTLEASDVALSDGRFATQLDFGESAFVGQDRWMEIAVRQPAGSGEYQVLSPRQKVVAAPMALFARSAGTLAGQPPAFFSNAANLTGTLPVASLPSVVARSDQSASFAGQVSAPQIGVGTTIPVARLSVAGSDSSANGTNAAISVTNSAAGGQTWWMRAGAVGTATPQGGFSIGDGTDYRLTITNAGRVGIGTRNPVATLDVNGDIALPGRVFTQGGIQFADGSILQSAANWPVLNGANAWDTPGSYSFVVPSGITRVEVNIFGASGGGGRSSPDAGGEEDWCGGSGGGSGSVLSVVQVTAGETLNIQVGNGGARATQTAGATNGGVTRVQRGATVLLQVTGGTGGQNATPNGGGDPGSGGVASSPGVQFAVRDQGFDGEGGSGGCGAGLPASDGEPGRVVFKW